VEFKDETDTEISLHTFTKVHILSRLPVCAQYACGDLYHCVKVRSTKYTSPKSLVDMRVRTSRKKRTL
jgi:hypothetical protein